jgi:hypothetical protein
MATSGFTYSVRINTSIDLDIIRFPNDQTILDAWNSFSETLGRADFYSLTRTAREISIVHELAGVFHAKLEKSVAEQTQIQNGFIVIEVVPDSGHQIDFGMNLGGR